MRLGNEYRIVSRTEYQVSSKGELEDLKRILQDLTYFGGISKRKAISLIDEYYKIINSDNFKGMMAEKGEYYKECLELISKISSAIEDVDYDSLKSPGSIIIPSDEKRLISLSGQLEKINSVLSDHKTTENEVAYALDLYQKLVSNKRNIRLMNDADNLMAQKAIKINNEIQDYLMRRDMVTFGYFVERMDNASKYAYDISVKYQREGMNKYVDYYKGVTTKLNSFGDYIKDSINDGKQNKVYKNKFYTDVYNAMKPYFYYGDGDGYTLYKNSMKIVKVGDDKFNVLIDGEIIEKEISYKEAYGKMEYFFSCHEPVIKGTRLCKIFKPVLDEFNNVIGLEGKVEQFLFPHELYDFMDLASDEKGLDRINENFDKCFKEKSPDLSNWNNVNEKSIAATSDVEYTRAILKKNYDAGFISYYENEAERNQYSEFYQHDINTKNQKIDGAKKGLQLTLDEYTQRYNTINSNYDNMLRTITTMISELAQELKGFLRF
ncbi:hypothetical protein [Morganella morganii]|uniref:hypothetical protein n=1 Tax=Morganella morganii TaxID=582 RepID=UPI0020239872|nr:hypothetical protein [Morganella morganii]